ncbi:MAG: D-tyrosyl-tRNA(Tyr) deacylase [Planctomycetes bacterium]|nr:D-tyrosyl-tRNA(Tyr) deacylase [Planctomycetota bacterium]MCD7895608.1 D-tyrosyl-tRNA(Tyr) deacylase [Planctomycetaceae bacterium]
MRAVVQRVTEASVTVDGVVTGKIDNGFLVLLGVTAGDTDEHVRVLAGKIARLRVFRDEQEKMNLSLLDTGGQALVVSQFTLYADVAKGNRPSFINAAPPDQANRLYEDFCAALAGQGVVVEKGVFGAHMDVRLLNDGPVTICLDTDVWVK